MPSKAVKILLASVFAAVVLALIVTLAVVLQNDTNPFQGECGRRPNLISLNISVNKGCIGCYEAGAGEFPWHADLGGCGGTIIDSYHIVTAAHCQIRNGSFVHAGNLKPQRSSSPTSTPTKSSVQRLKVIQVQNHACYCRFQRRASCQSTDACPRRTPGMNDIALLTTEQPFKFDNFVQPICRPEENENFQDVLLSGFGRFNTTQNRGSEELRGIEMPVISQSECEKAMKEQPIEVKEKSMICAGKGNGTGSCHGDSGGPLIAFRDVTKSEIGVFVGVVSWGSPRCDSYGVYTRVTNYLSWINEAVKKSPKHDEAV